MASPRELVEAVANILCVPVPTVIVHDRNLATATVPLRRVGGRGLAAAKMTSTDAANLLVAVLASESVKDSVRTVQLFGPMRAHDPLETGIARFDELPDAHTFSDALAAMIEAAAAREMKAFKKIDLKFSFHMPNPRIKFEWEIDGNASEIIYGPPTKDFRTIRKEFPIGDLEKIAIITENTIFYLGDAVADRVKPSH